MVKIPKTVDEKKLNVKNQISIRLAECGDIHDITRLYSETVRNVNSKDYSPEEIKVWAEGAENTERWQKAIAEQYFILAYIENNLAGFGSIADDGYLDFLYVSKDHQRMAVAKALLFEIERKAREQKNNRIYSHVSKTARGFFEKHGYICEREIEDPYKGVVFINALMVKNL